MANYKLSYTASQFEQAMKAYNEKWKDVSQVTASAANVLAGTYIVTNQGRIQGTMKNNGNVAGTISTKDGNYTIPTGYHSGSGTVKISDTEKAKIIPANIKKGVTILGQTGTCEAGTTTSGTDTTDATASASDIRSGKTAYVNGRKLTGTIPNQAAQTITPGTTDKTISSGKYLSGTQTIKGDSKLVASNIKSGISIFGVTGTYTGSSSGSSSGSGLPNTIIAGDTPVIANWAGMNITSTTMTDTKISITIKRAGTYRFKIPAVAKSSFSSGSPTVSLYKNGTSANSTTITSSTVECVSFDLECAVGDVISVYAKAVGSNYSSTTVTVFGLIACIDWANGL
nr:MAG TPA: tail protein [Bacteriophage sp.]